MVWPGHAGLGCFRGVFWAFEKLKSMTKAVGHCVLMGAALLMAACTPMTFGEFGQNRVEPRDPQVVASPDKVSLMLAESADKAANALQTLAAVEQAQSPGVRVPPISDAPPELARAITINWIGPAEQLGKALADRASYGFLTLGDAPPVPLTVNIDAVNQPIIDVLRDLGLQMGERATLRVDSSRRVIELHYAPVNSF